MTQTYRKPQATGWSIPNYWDFAAFVLVISVIFLLGFGAKEMLGQYHLGEKIPISLSPTELPYYSLRTVLRMFIAMFFSLLFTFVFGAWAAKSRRAERVIIPMIDILQSVPILGFLSITIVGFIVLFHGSMLGPECAAIFAIFTAQVWNMTLSFYQSLKTLPNEWREAAKMFQLSGWQTFWRVEVPFALPGLLWNAMMSMSGSWVFLTASEAITVAKQDITLPGIGSYIALAISQKDLSAVFYVIATMFVVIGLYDQLLFRPLVAWSEKFKAEEAADENPAESWVLDLFQRTAWFLFITEKLSHVAELIVNLRVFKKNNRVRLYKISPILERVFEIIFNILLIFLVVSSIFFIGRFVSSRVTIKEIEHVFYLGLMTGLRVFILIIISSFIWVPIGVWIGLRPKVSYIVQPIAQFFAAFPTNLLFPLVVILITRYHLNVNIWVSPLVILGTQWYILFNVVAGTIALPKNLKQAVATLNVKGWLWWKKFILPGIFPFYITGAITAAGGAWNVSIIAEAVSWGSVHLHAVGLGAYIDQVSHNGDFARLALGIGVMALYVLTINRLLWRPLYNLAEERFQIR